MAMEIKCGLLETEYKADVKNRQGIETTYEDGKKIETIIDLSEHIDGHCCDGMCPRVLKHDEICFIDTWNPNGSVYCHQCGQCLKYERRKASDRGESARDIKVLPK